MLFLINLLEEFDTMQFHARVEFVLKGVILLCNEVTVVSKTMMKICSRYNKKLRKLLTCR